MEHIDEHIGINREAIKALDTDINGTNGLASKVSIIGTNEVSDYNKLTLWQAIRNLYNATNVEG